MNNNKNEVSVVMGPSLKKIGVKTISGYFPISQLRDRTLVDKYDPQTPDDRTKYQRELNAKRVNELTVKLQNKKLDIPTSVTFNIRDEDWKDDFVEERNGGWVLRLDKMRESKAKFRTMDGQHRTESYTNLFEALEEKYANGDTTQYEEWQDFGIPFVATLGAAYDREMLIFYEVNKNAKAVPTNLAYMILSDLVKKESGGSAFRKELEEAGISWTTDGTEVVRKLHTEPGLWQGRIRMPNSKKEDQTIQLSGMVNSLGKLLKSNVFFGNLTLEAKVEVINAYWKGLRMCMPDLLSDEGFENVMTKSVGVAVMHEVFEYVMEVLRSNSQPINEPESYFDLLKNPMMELAGQNGEDEETEGEDFWKTGSSGVAGQFTSEAAKRRLSNEIKRLIKNQEGGIGHMKPW